MYTVYDRTYGHCPAKNTVYTYVRMVLANPMYVCVRTWVHHVQHASRKPLYNILTNPRYVCV